MTQASPAVLGEDASCHGRLNGTNLTILGHFEGALTLTGAGRTGERSSVRGEVQAHEMTVGGEFEGTIRAGRLVFGRQARARGDFHADRIAVEDGALVDGRFNPPPAEAEPEATAAPVEEAAPEPAATAGEDPDAAPEAPVPLAV